MQKSLPITTTVQPGDRVEFASPELEAGQTMDIVVRLINYYIKHRMGREGCTLTRDAGMLM